MTIQNVATSPQTAFLTQSVDRLSAQNADLQGQLSSGVLSDSYAGLGDQRFLALDLEPSISEAAAWQGNITDAQTTLSVTQSAMTTISSIANKLQTSLTSLVDDKSSSNVDLAASEARQSLTQLASLLNTKNGSQYVFAGASSDTAPVTDASAITSSSFFETIAAAVSSVGSNGAAATEATTLSAASDDDSGQTVFSAALSTDPVSAAALGRNVTVGAEDHVTIGFVATQGQAASGMSTGSSIRDLMRALAVTGSLDQADSSSVGFTTLVSDTSGQMSDISSGLVTAAAAVGETQAQLTSQGSSLSDVSDALTKQLGLVRDSDPALLSTQITATQNQLQASYSLIADMKGMSLAAYI